jgi:ribosome-associated protein
LYFWLSERTPALSIESSRQNKAETAAAVHVTGDHGPIEALEALVLQSLDDDKAEDVVSIDLRGKSSVTDFMIIATGRSNRHVNALTEHLHQALKDAGRKDTRIEGLQTCDWVLMDVGDIVIHLFRPEVRSFYNLEKMWSVEPEDNDAA